MTAFKKVGFEALNESHVKSISETAGGMAWHGDEDKWKNYLEEHRQGKRFVYIAVSDGKPVGYGSLIFSPKYAFFNASNIPEISDVVVSENWRGKGIATQIIKEFEDKALQTGHDKIGLGVGLYKDYGPAQQLYYKLGYVPDGNGITAGSSSEIAKPGSLVKLDDDLVLWLVKNLKPVPN